MKSLKKLARKPIAVIVALMIITGTLAVAFAAENFSFSTRTEFFKLVDDEWVSTTYASVEPGDEIRADVYLTSDRVVGAVRILMSYDSEALTFDSSKHVFKSTLSGLAHYDLPTYDSNYGGEFIDDGTNWLDVIGEDDGMHKAFDITIDSWVAKKYTDYKMLYFYFTVNEDYFSDETIDKAEKLAKIGTFGLSLGSKSTPDNVNYPTQPQLVVDDSNEGKTPEEITGRNSILAASRTNFTLSTDPGTLNFKGYIGFDSEAPYGSIVSGDSPASSIVVSDFYGKYIDEEAAPEMVVDENYQFIGWSLAEASGVQTIDGRRYYGGDYEQMLNDPVIFDTADDYQTLYAIYSDADTKYAVKLLAPSLDASGKELTGEYETVAIYNNRNGAVNDVVSADDTNAVNPAWIDSAFYENNSTESITLVLDQSENVLEVHLTRKTTQIKWIIDDEVVKGPETVYCGGNAGTANYPNPTAADLGDDYFGKEITWTGHEISPVSGNDSPIEVIGTVANLPITVYINAQDTTNNVTGTWYGEEGVVNHEVTGLKYNDSIPSDAASTLQRPRGYDSIIYIYNDADGNEQRVTSLSQIPAINKENVEIGTDMIFRINTEYVIYTGNAVFNANGGSFEGGATTDSIPYTYGDVIAGHAAPENHKSDGGHDYDFLGWATTSDATEPNVVFDSEGPVFDSEAPAEDPVFYAVWEYDIVKLVPVDADSTAIVERGGIAETYASFADDIYPATVTDVVEPFWNEYGEYSSSTYDDWFLTGLGDYGMTVEDLQDYVRVTGDGSFKVIWAEDGEEYELLDDEYLGTGCQIIVLDKNGAEVERFYVVIYGDIDGDGLPFQVGDTTQYKLEASNPTGWSSNANEVKYLVKAVDIDQDGMFGVGDQTAFKLVNSNKKSLDQVNGYAD